MRRSRSWFSLTLEAPLDCASVRSLAIEDLWHAGWIAMPPVNEAPVRLGKLGRPVWGHVRPDALESGADGAS